MVFEGASSMQAAEVQCLADGARALPDDDEATLPSFWDMVCKSLIPVRARHAAERLPKERLPRQAAALMESVGRSGGQSASGQPFDEASMDHAGVVLDEMVEESWKELDDKMEVIDVLTVLQMEQPVELPQVVVVEVPRISEVLRVQLQLVVEVMRLAAQHVHALPTIIGSRGFKLNVPVRVRFLFACLSLFWSFVFPRRTSYCARLR